MAEEIELRADHGGRGGEHRIETDGSEGEVNCQDSKTESEIAHAINNKRLDRCRIGSRALIPKADQQIGNQTNALPAEI